MTDNKEIVELQDEQLEKVNGGERGSINYKELKYYRAYRIINATGKRAVFEHAENVGTDRLKLCYHVVALNNGKWEKVQGRSYKSYEGFLKYVDVKDYINLA